MKNLKFILLTFVLCAVLTPVKAQSERWPDVKIMFDINSAEVKKSFGDNAKAFDVLDKMFIGNDETYKIEYIEVASSSSIDGSYTHNQDLSQKRINAVRAFLIRRYPSVPQSLFRYMVIGENWKNFREVVVADAQVPYRGEVLMIIDNRSAPDYKELELRNLHKGVTWDYLKDNVFPQQRYGVGVMVVLKKEYRQEEAKPEEKIEEKPEEKTVAQAEPIKDDKILLALKTNLLADAVSAINLELEVPIGNHYSVAAEFKFPWFRGVNSDFTMQILSGHIEGKYWFGNRTKENRLLGFSAGVFTGFGTYDIQPFTSTGTSGDFFQLGVMAGYSHSIYKSLNLEYELGLAYIHSGYHQYEMANIDGLGYVKEMRGESREGKVYKNTFLPTRFKVSLVWNFGMPAFWK